MLDTARFRSPGLNKDQEDAFIQLCKLRRCIDVASGGLEWELFTGTLVGSYDNRISVKLIDRECYSIHENGKTVTYTRVLDKKKVEIEGSIHKAMLGHNVIGGSSRFLESCRWFINQFEEIMQVSLPSPELWEVLRIDTAEIFNIDVSKYFKTIGHLYYPRKGESGIQWYNTSFALSTTMIYFKAYDKGAEFKTHEFLRVARILGLDKARLLQQMANGILRIEIELRHKKLKALYGKNPLVGDVQDTDLKKVWDEEVAKVLQLKDFMRKNGEVYNTSEKVRERLMNMCNPREARTLLGSWNQLATFGEKTCKEMMSSATLKRHKARLKELSISWIGTDIMLSNECEPLNWIPTRSDACCIEGEAPEVTELLDKFIDKNNVKSA